MKRLRPALALVALLMLCIGPTSADPGTGGQTHKFVDAGTGLDGWIFEGQGIKVQMSQRLPDQTRAFFLGRGFDLKSADYLASRCLFQTTIHSTAAIGGPGLDVDLTEWRVSTPRGWQPPIIKRQWQQEWQRRGVSKAARIAFQWSLFPTRQQFQPGDWNMGMTTYPIAPGSRLDLELVWHLNGRRLHGRMTGLVCANDTTRKEKRP